MIEDLLMKRFRILSKECDLIIGEIDKLIEEISRYQKKIIKIC